MAVSGALKRTTVTLMKIANDLRSMNSGPIAGLGEIRLPALQPGSSIMPGKVNPAVPEAVTMVCAQVIGHDAAITIAGQSGNFELNVMLPVIGADLLEMIGWLASASQLLAERAMAGFEFDVARLNESLSRNPILVTTLNPVIGYARAAEIARAAFASGRPINEVALEKTDLKDRSQTGRVGAVPRPARDDPGRKRRWGRRWGQRRRLSRRPHRLVGTNQSSSPLVRKVC